MNLHGPPLSIIIFGAFVVLVLFLSYYFARRATSAAGYFAAGGQIHWAVNGISFAGELRGGESSPRDYIYCWYQRNGVRATASQHARTAHLKLYADGRLFNSRADPHDEPPLPTAPPTEDDRAAYTMLRDALTHHVAITEICDPIQNEKRGE